MGGKRFLDVYESKQRPGPRTNKALGGAPENKSGTVTHKTVDFASDEAAEAAAEAGLNADDFEGYDPSGAGGYTKADVQKVARDKEDAD